MNATAWIHLTDYASHTRPAQGLQRQYNPRGLSSDEYNPRVLNGLEVLRTMDNSIPYWFWDLLKTSPDFGKDEEQLFWNCLILCTMYLTYGPSEGIRILRKSITTPVEQTERMIRETEDVLLKQCLQMLVMYQRLSPPTFTQFCERRGLENR